MNTPLKNIVNAFPETRCNKRCEFDDVVDNFVDITSLFADSKNIYALSVAGFVETKPYIGMEIKMTDPKTNETIAADQAKVSDLPNISMSSIFENLSAQYIGKPVNLYLEVYWINPDGSTNRMQAKETMTVELAEPVKSAKVTKPRAADGVKTIVVYGTYTGSLKPDYQYANNKRVNSTVSAMLPLEGNLQFEPEWIPTSIDLTSEGGKPKLYMLMSTGAVWYEKDFADVFTLSDSQVAFKLNDEDWGSKVDTSRFGSAMTIDLYFSFTVKLKNRLFPTNLYTAKIIVVCKPELIENAIINITLIEPAYIYWDCIAEGSMVAMYPEGEKTIAEIKLNDRVKTSSGKSAKVVEITKTKADQIIQIHTQSGKTLGVTPSHPIKTNVRFIEAQQLTNCSYVLTREEGGSIAIDGVTELTRETSANAYSILLDSEHELICNGIITGDRSQLVQSYEWSSEVLVLREQLSRLFSTEYTE